MRSTRLPVSAVLVTVLGVMGTVLGVGRLTVSEASEPATEVTAEGSSAPSATVPTAARSGAAVSDRRALAEGQVTEASMADPFVVRAEGRYWLYATNTHGANVPVLSSTDGAHWTDEGDALPVLPEGALAGKSLVWAPSVLALDGRYVMYVTVFDEATDEPCIAVATADRPDGPFVTGEDWRLECGRGAGGVIDASPVQDGGGSWWVVFKNEGSAAVGNALWSARLAADGLTTVGSSTPLLWADQDWEHGVVEGPSMVALEGGYLLVYSAAVWDDSAYSTGLAWCTTVTGPCTKLADGPVLASGWGGDGPGGGEVFTDASGHHWVVYHQRDPEVAGPGQSRRPYLISLADLCDLPSCSEA